jgi:hypothetical protein
MKSEKQQVYISIIHVPQGSRSRSAKEIRVNLNRTEILNSVFVYNLLIFTLLEIKLKVYFSLRKRFPRKSTWSQCNNLFTKLPKKSLQNGSVCKMSHSIKIAIFPKITVCAFQGYVFWENLLETFYGILF